MLLAFGCFTAQAQTQIAIIQDPDGYTNIRSEPGLEFDIIGKVHEGEYFWVEESEEKWLGISCPCEGDYIEGYIHRSRVQMLTIPDGSEVREANRWKWKNAELQVEILTEDFLLDQHQIERSPEGFVKKIDGESPLGVDGGLPREQVKSVSITFEDGEFLELPKAAIQGMFEPSFHGVSVFVRLPEIVLVIMRNSDGAGGYTVIWEIKNRQYVSQEIMTF